MDVLSVQKRCLNHDKRAVYRDIFINEKPFQNIIKKQYPNHFNHGRFAETFLPILGRDFPNKRKPKDDHVSGFIPENFESLITPIYGCIDNCCVYLYLKLKKKNEVIIWEEFGKNTNFIFDKEINKNSIEWFSIQPNYHFKTNNYINLIKELK